MTKIKNTKEFTPGVVTFSGAFDSDAVTINGNVMRLFVFSCTDIKINTKEKVTIKILELDRYFNRDGKTVDEGSSDDCIGEFEGYLENKDGKFFFSEMKLAKEINWTETAPYPYFRVAFAGEKDTVTNKADNDPKTLSFPVVIGKNDEPPESPEFEIGFMIEKEDGTFLGGSNCMVSYFYGQYSYKPILDMFDIRTQLDSVNLLNITNALIQYAPEDGDKDSPLFQTAVASTTAPYQGSITQYNDRKMKAVNAAVKEIETLIKTSKNPYFQNIKAVNDYYDQLGTYRSHVETYQNLKKSPYATQDDCNYMVNNLILPMAKNLNTLEDTIHQYLKNSSKPPKEYTDRIANYAAIITRNKTIDEIINNPLVRVIGLLPGAGVVTGTLKVIKGDTIGGFIDIFGSIVTYGSFLKLARVAQAYRKSTQSTTELLFNYRYRKLVSTITNAKIMNKISETGLREINRNVGILFETVYKFKSLKGHIDSIALLHKNRNYITKLTMDAIAGINAGLIKVTTKDYMFFLKELEDTNATLEFFAHLRLLHTFVKASRDAGKVTLDTLDAYQVTFDAMDDVRVLLGFKEVPGVKDFDPEVADKITEMFVLMRDRGFKIDEIISAATSSFPSDSAIIEHFNKELVKYDMFGLRLNADVRYENTRQEMLIALDSIDQKWTVEKSRRDKWVEANKAKYNHQYLRELQIQWARTNKSNMSISLPESLETCIDNFVEKIKGQIAKAEALEGKNELPFLDMTVNESKVSGTKLIFDLNIIFFKEHATNLVKRYY